MIHTLAHYAFYVAASFSAFAFLVAVGVGLYSTLALAAASDGTVYTSVGRVNVGKDEIEVNWGGPAACAVCGLCWALVALALHAL